MKIGVIGSGYIGTYLREAIMLSNLNAEAIIIDNNNKDQFQDFVKPKKIQLVTKAINEYIQQKNLDLSVRFDIISVYKNNNKYDLEHIEDAFYFF